MHSGFSSSFGKHDEFPYLSEVHCKCSIVFLNTKGGISLLFHTRRGVPFVIFPGSDLSQRSSSPFSLFSFCCFVFLEQPTLPQSLPTLFARNVVYSTFHTTTASLYTSFSSRGCLLLICKSGPRVAFPGRPAKPILRLFKYKSRILPRFWSSFSRTPAVKPQFKSPLSSQYKLHQRATEQRHVGGGRLESLPR